jgi:hypothetical protein
MYSCERCGWATTTFRVEAVREHEADCPECAGALRMVFHLETATRPVEPTREDLQDQRDQARERAVQSSIRDRHERRRRPQPAREPAPPRRGGSA